jgi:hypothetical protein
MARKPYPRSTLRRVLLAHTNRQHKLSPSVDILVFLDYMLFLRALVQEAELQAAVQASASFSGSVALGAASSGRVNALAGAKAKGKVVKRSSLGITAGGVRKVSQDVLRRFRG